MGKRKAAGSEKEGNVGNGGTPRSSRLIEMSNALSPETFIERYWTEDLLENDVFSRKLQCKVLFESASQMSATTLQACFDLIEQTSRHDYEPSSFGWHPKRKLREMKEKEMRYITLRNSANGIEGFLSFMLTHDSVPAVPVLYVYEVHLSPRCQGQGIGTALMVTAEGIARNVGVEKVMLTCFKSNVGARAFYEHLGYDVDVSSPEDRTTRNKVVKTDYVIMSKSPEKPKAYQPLAKSAISTVSNAQLPQNLSETDEYRTLKHDMAGLIARMLKEHYHSQGGEFMEPFEKVVTDVAYSLARERQAMREVAEALLPTYSDSDYNGSRHMSCGLERKSGSNACHDALSEAMKKALSKRVAKYRASIIDQDKKARPLDKDLDSREQQLDRREQQLDLREDDLFARETTLQEANTRQDRARQNIRARARALQQREARFAAREQRSREAIIQERRRQVTHVPAEPWLLSADAARHPSAKLEARDDCVEGDMPGKTGEEVGSGQDDDALEGIDQDLDSGESEEGHYRGEVEDDYSEDFAEPDGNKFEPDIANRDQAHRTRTEFHTQGKHTLELPKPEAMRGRLVVSEKPETWLRRSGSTLDSFTRER